ncbi:MAG TPA: carboxypeptidase-like regulatory domain-containing protein [Terriglobales bacterium]|nr:carboxypeptidase-like regulatory domain-containing protein [Terriglobales bacterium]
MMAVAAPPRRQSCLQLALFFAVLAAAPLHAQIFKLQGGDSSLLDASGGSIDFKASNYQGSLGAGFFQGRFALGTSLQTQFRGYTWVAGDDNVQFDLPTDIFDGGHYFTARGAGFSKGDADNRLFVFGGVTSTWLGTGFFSSAQAEDPAGILFYQRRLSETFRLYSRMILSRRNTSLQALEWQPKKWLKNAITAGTGSGQGYFATSSDLELKTLSLRASYVFAGQDFRRVNVPSLMDSEADRGNVEATYQPNSSVSLTAGHRELLQPLSLDSPLERASVNELAGNFHISNTYFGAGLFTSSVTQRRTQGTNLYLGHRIGERVEMTVNYFTSHTTSATAPGATTPMLSGTFREKLSPRFSLLQLVTRYNGQWTAAYGGEFLTNRLNVRADYQNVYLPFRPDRPFEQALALDASLRIVGPIRLTVGSNVAPDGRIRYTFGGSTYLYRYRGLSPWHSESPDSYNFPKYLVQGVVRDEQGAPIQGAALKINGETVYTDEAGHFMLRLRRRSPVSFQLAPDEFLIAGKFQIVHAPATVIPDTEDRTGQTEVVLRRMKP